MTTNDGEGTPDPMLPTGSMHAILQSAYGEDPATVLRFEEVARPSPGPGDVVVEVAAASIDRGTWHLMAGRPQLMRLMGFGVRRPKALNPGRAFAGTVVEAGADVRGLRPGDAVYGTCDGSFAEYVAAPVDKVAHKPRNLSFEDSAAVPVSAVAALQAVRDQAHVEAGQRALVIGASGGVGSFIVQLVKAYGGSVTGVASTSKVDLVRQLGADEVIDYTQQDFADGHRTYDVVFDTGGNRPLSEVRRALAPGGTLVVVGGETDGKWLGGFARNLRTMLLAPAVRGQHLRSLTAKENAADLEALRALFEEGKLASAVDRAYPLAETPAAIRYLMDGRVRGKLVVSM
jgi:2-desacetyl-2-hydroxyethyl bacteriochlorophyllide A dehydrogenase